MQAVDFVESYFAAWNHHDPQRIASHLTSDGVFCDVPENTRRGPSELIADLADFFAAHDHHYELIGEIMCGDNTLAFQYRIHTGSRRATAYSGAEFVTLAGDSAARITDYYDMSIARPRITELATRVRQHRKYAKSGLSTAQLQVYLQRLEQVMCAEQLYLRPDMTLPRLADVVGCSVNHLSQVINAGVGMSFFDYLNQYRVEQAQAMLRNPSQSGDAILNIAFAVGFNSNSAFYTAFKKTVGQTPAQYRKSQLGQPH